MLHSDQINIMYSKTYSDDIYENEAYFIWVKNRYFIDFSLILANFLIFKIKMACK